MRQVVINALGLKLAAGQTPENLVSIQETEFSTSAQIALNLEAAQAAQPGWQTYVELASRWAAVAGAALVLLVFWRMLKREKPEVVPIEALTVAADNSSRAVPANGPVTPELLNELIRQKPANIGVALREWVAAGSSPAGKN